MIDFVLSPALFTQMGDGSDSSRNTVGIIYPRSPEKSEAVALKDIYFISVHCYGSKEFSLL